ncbi:Carbon catabolite repressor protein 4 -like protein 3 [Capsicum chinense]|nr:Carbon catabolite repressor protein 4 -like protein 3 [Capsicum chinense]
MLFLVANIKRRTGCSVDGCAMFWKADKFQLLEGESIEFRQYGPQGNVAQLSVFVVVVVNCKLLFLCSAIPSRLMGSASDERMLEIWIIGWEYNINLINRVIDRRKGETCDSTSVSVLISEILKLQLWEFSLNRHAPNLI